MKRTIFFTVIIMLMGTSASAATFVNGGFEDGNWNGWTVGSGTWSQPFVAPNPTDYLPGGPKYDGGNIFNLKSAIVTPGDDPIVGSLLNQVFSDQHAARVNNWDTNWHVSVISQTVANYTDPSIYFAWAAVLQESHGIGDSGNFSLKLTDDTDGTTLYSVGYDSASTPGYFNKVGSWFYSDWQVQQLDVSARVGHTFTLTLLGSDCPYGGHAGYVYLDGFGAAPPQPTVPEPATIMLLGAGLAGIALLRKRI